MLALTLGCHESETIFAIFVYIAPSSGGHPSENPLEWIDAIVSWVCMSIKFAYI